MKRFRARLTVIGEALVRRAHTPLNLGFLAGRRGGPRPEGGWGDLLLLAGAIAIIRGVGIWNTGAAWVIAGGFLLAAAFWMAGDNHDAR